MNVFLLPNTSGKFTDDSFELLQFRGDNLCTDLALQIGVKKVIAYTERLVYYALIRHVTSGARRAVDGIMIGNITDDGAVPGYELSTNDRKHELDLRGGNAGALEQFGHLLNREAVGGKHKVHFARLTARR